MATKLFGRDLHDYDNMDVDQMLETLSAAEIEELNNYVDPDVSYSINFSPSICKIELNY
jgi:Tropomodulin